MIFKRKPKKTPKTYICRHCGRGLEQERIGFAEWWAAEGNPFCVCNEFGMHEAVQPEAIWDELLRVAEGLDVP